MERSFSVTTFFIAPVLSVYITPRFQSLLVFFSFFFRGWRSCGSGGGSVVLGGRGSGAAIDGVGFGGTGDVVTLAPSSHAARKFRKRHATSRAEDGEDVFFFIIIVVAFTA